MSYVAAKLALALALPVAVFLGGVWIMSICTCRQHVHQLLSKVAAADQKPLNSRFGYDVGAVDRHWSAFAHDSRALTSEQRFLEMDLVFPFLYGAALATSLLVVWALLGRVFNPAWVLAPVVITVLADWTENLVLMVQLRRFAESGVEGLSAGWIQVASIATILKIVFFVASSLLIVALMIAVLSSYVGRCSDGNETQAGTG